MKLRLVFPLLVFSLLLVGCKHIKGTLDLNSDLTLKDKHGKSFVLAPGQYTMDWTKKNVFGKKFVSFWVKDLKGKKHTVHLPDPGITEVPSESGEFLLEAGKIKQNFDVAGKVSTEVSNSDSVRAVESCSIPLVSMLLFGNREVTYHVRTTSLYIKTAFLSLQNGSELGAFDGADVKDEVVYDYYGPCLI